MTEDDWIDTTTIGSLYEEQENYFTGQVRRRPLRIDPDAPLGVSRDNTQPWQVVTDKDQ